MKTKILSLTICLLVTSLLLTSCGPKVLNDAEFAEEAQSVCSTLQADNASLNAFDLNAKAKSYQKAADALAAFNITERSAPKGTQLRLGLARLAESFEEFSQAIGEAVAKANLKNPVTLMITTDGTVLGSSGSIFDTTKLEIDPTILSELKANQAQVQDAANSLELEACVITWPGE